MPNRDRIEGKGREIGGTLQEKTGEITGDEELEARGAANKTEGKVQGTFGKVKEKAGDLKDKITGD